MKLYKKTIRDVPLERSTILLRTDYNVPLLEDGTIADDYRIRASLPTIRWLLKVGCKVVIVTHLGRPEGVDLTLSLEPVAQRLAELLGEPVRFVDKTVGEKVRMAIKRAPKRSVTVLENLRFHPEEEANDDQFARQLARDSSARYFVQDGFGVVHRDHASTSAITTWLPSVAGLLLEKEYTMITSAMEHPERPFVAVLGGAKVSDKIAFVQRLVEKADHILIGGAMANTFLAYKGVNVGVSKRETGQTKVLKDIYAAATEKVGSGDVDEFLVLPSDVATAKTIDEEAVRTVKTIGRIADDDLCLDIGDASAKRYVEIVRRAKTVIWNGTLGRAELPAFAKSSAELAGALTKQAGKQSVIGGGDTVDFVLDWDKKRGGSFDHISTGGGASLQLMSGETLPGIEHLLDA